MSNHRNNRGTRGRGFDEDGGVEEPSYFRREPARQAMQANSATIQAEVLWFNSQKGFGFVKLPDGSDAFLHIRALEAAGHNAVSEGMRLTVRLGEGAKGPQVAEVLEIGPQTTVRTPAPPSHPARGPAAMPLLAEQAGTVKWYNAEKGFGFVAIDGGGKDAFVHVTALKRSGLEAIEEGQRVVVEVAQGQKGPEVRSLKLA